MDTTITRAVPTLAAPSVLPAAGQGWARSISIA